MARCPHCGESVKPGQDTCFACGQKIRVRRRQGGAPVNPVVFLVAAVVAVAAIVGAVIVSTNSGNRTKSRKKHLEQARIQDSIRAAVRARRDTARQDAAQERSNQLMDELDKMEQRFNAVRQEVVKERPSPAQEKLIGQFRAEMGRVRALAGTIALASEAKADSIKDEVRESERVIRGLISDLSRAPKK